MKIVNLTPHDIVLNDGRVFPSEGVARVAEVYTPFDEDGICQVTRGAILNLPSPIDGVVYAVSSLVLAEGKRIGRTDLVVPATGHPDCRRINGFIESVPGFVR